MGLQKYKAKRDFEKTPEPAGEEKPSPSGRMFVVQKHAASRLHYDFRLELDGVLKSWAVPKGPSLDPAQKHLAVQVEDHPVDYGHFEGIIPEGEYGGGTVMLWDFGTWEPLGNPHKDLAAGRLKFTLNGKKLRGGWMLLRLKPGNEDSDEKVNWLLFKERDEEAGSSIDITGSEPLSAQTGRTMEEIAGEQDKVWRSNRAESTAKKNEAPARARRAAGTRATASESGGARKTRADVANPKIKPRSEAEPESATAAAPDPGKIPGARKAAQPAEPRAELATLVEAVPPGDDWLYEIKFDGYRMLGVIDAGRGVRLISRNGNEWTARFGEVAEALRALPLSQGVVDGEIVVLRPDGTTDFQALQNFVKAGVRARAVYFLFDLLHAEGYDLTRAPLIERKELLRGLLRGQPAGGLLRFSDHVIGDGQLVLEQACRLGMEGVIAKGLKSSYVAGRGKGWLKLKCIQRQEFVIGGFTDPQGSRTGFGALLLGVHNDKGELVHCGRVGTGFSQASIAELGPRLRALETRTAPFDNPPRGADARGVHWMKPELVCEVEFIQWTSDGILRHPSFQGLREDKPAREVRRERPEAPPPEPEDASPAVAETPAAVAPQAEPKPVKSGTVRRRAGPTGAAGTDDTIGGVRLSHPERPMYAEQGLTKRAIARYYESVADLILPFLVGRPLTLVRCPQGSGQKCFFQKHVTETMVAPIRAISVIERDGPEDYVAIDDLRGLITLVQLGVLELHLWGASEGDLEHPNYLVFDLDPGEGVAWPAVNLAATRLRDRLAALGLVSFVKTTGGKGLHVCVPLKPGGGGAKPARGRKSGVAGVAEAAWPGADWEQVKTFTRAVAESLMREFPGDYLITMTKAKRQGKIFIDYLRNGRGATSISPFSTRARPGAPVSVPLEWNELAPTLAEITWTTETLPARLAALKKRRRDPWSGFFEVAQTLTPEMLKKMGVS